MKAKVFGHTLEIVAWMFLSASNVPPTLEDEENSDLLGMRGTQCKLSQ